MSSAAHSDRRELLAMLACGVCFVLAGLALDLWTDLHAGGGLGAVAIASLFAVRRVVRSSDPTRPRPPRSSP